MVRIEFSNRIVILVKTFVEFDKVIGISFLNTQNRIEVIIWINGITYPRDVTKDILITLINSEIHIHTSRVIRRLNDTICYDLCIAITNLVVFFNDKFFVIFELLLHKLLGTEEIDNIIIIGLLHRTVDLGMRKRLVTCDIQLTYTSLVFLVDIDRHLHITRASRVIELKYLDLGMIETFLLEILGNDFLSTICEVGSHLTTLLDAHFDFQVLLFGFLQSIIDDFRDTRALLERNLQPDLITLDLSCLELDIRE